MEHCPTQVEYNNLCLQTPTKGYEVALTLTMAEIQNCSQMSMPEQIIALASTAKKQRAEVREKELSPADLALFKSAKEKEIKSWLSTETVRENCKESDPRRANTSFSMGPNMETYRTYERRRIHRTQVQAQGQTSHSRL